MSDDTSLLMVLLLWVITVSCMLTHAWQQTQPSAGLALAYLCQLGINHWVGAFIQLLPWHDSPGRQDTIAGFAVTGYCMVGLLVGNLILALLLVPAQDRPAAAKAQAAVFITGATRYLVTGFLFAFLLLPFALRIPTFNAIVGTGMNLAVAGFCMLWYAYWTRGQIARTWLVFAALSLLPFVGLLFSGFLGQGVLALSIVVCFALVFYRPRRTILVVGLGGLFLGLSLYPTYMKVRGDIRKAVWGQASYGERLEAAAALGSEWEWFDPERTSHLEAIELRLNQNRLVGRAVSYLDHGHAEFARGSTVYDALLALVPRVLWPDKPMFAGSGELVTRYTGIRFGQGTSVGIGHVMELYINFGNYGALFGFLVLGTLLGCLDRISARHLVAGDWKRFAIWFVPGLAFLGVGGNFAEATASAAASVAVCWLLNWWLPDTQFGQEPPRASVYHPLDGRAADVALRN
jgi:hypothetical protein